jgi:hypothetical protein
MPYREIIAVRSEINTKRTNIVRGQNVEFFFSTWQGETVAFLGQDAVICKIVMDNKCLQQVKNFNYLSWEFRTKMKNIFNKSNRICSNVGDLNSTFKPNLV